MWKNKYLYLIILFFYGFVGASASLLDRTKNFTPNSQTVSKTEENTNSSLWIYDMIVNLFYDLLGIVIIIFVLFIALKIVRLVFEVNTAKDLVYVKVTLPKADSKLDKEKETKKDFKEKTSMMTMFYKAIHKISDAWLKDTILDKIFDHSKISFELIYEQWEVGFYIVT